ncbi:MAG TPA: methyltransferase domain-containing protein [Bacteroidales bacterium]|nr:methyltransferase domain-containing protein [Bacteroidales bacterium]
MKLSRNFTNGFNWFLDNMVPPFIRDSKICIKPLFWLLFGKKARFFLDFKNKAVSLSEEQLFEYYKFLADVHLKRDTDLNKESINYILENITGDTVLDIASGRGYLAKRIAEKYHAKVTGIDFLVNDDLKTSVNPVFLEGSIEKIPFPDKHFDTVICAHTLEHVINIQHAIAELRRVCNSRLIVVLPRQREYLYTFDLHVHFFPYEHAVLNVFKNPDGHCFSIHNDWVYVEDFQLL